MSRDEENVRIFNFVNLTWSVPPGIKPGRHGDSKCGRTRDINGRDIVIVAQSGDPNWINASHILDLEVRTHGVSYLYSFFN